VSDDRQDPFPDQAETGEAPPAGLDEPEPRSGESTGIAWGAILIMLGIALVVVFTVQNTDPVPVSFLWMEGRFPLAVVLLITIGAVILLTELVGVSYRRRRRRRQQDREELKRYRGP
jgi:uncharacterized integral membrane protein